MRLIDAAKWGAIIVPTAALAVYRFRSAWKDLAEDESVNRDAGVYEELAEGIKELDRKESTGLFGGRKLGSKAHHRL